MYQIEIANNQTALKIDRRAVRRAVTMTLKMEAVTAATISIAIVDNETIHDINRNFLKHDFETDVISFLFHSEGGTSDAKAAQQRGAGKTLNGEIVLSADYAISTAHTIGWQPEEEITLYIVHGLLHLCGFDDLTKAELPLMRRRERDVLEALGLDLPLRHDDPKPTPTKTKSKTEEQSAAAKPTQPKRAAKKATAKKAAGVKKKSASPQTTSATKRRAGGSA